MSVQSFLLVYKIIFMHVGAPAHFTLRDPEIVDQRFRTRYTDGSADVPNQLSSSEVTFLFLEA